MAGGGKAAEAGYSFTLPEGIDSFRLCERYAFVSGFRVGFLDPQGKETSIIRPEGAELAEWSCAHGIGPTQERDWSVFVRSSGRGTFELGVHYGNDLPLDSNWTTPSP